MAEICFQTVSQLQSQLLHSLESPQPDYDAIRHQLDLLEIAVNHPPQFFVSFFPRQSCEENHTDGNLYPVSMAVYLIQNDIFGAKYLWKRTPSYLKSDPATGTELNLLWAITKSLIENSLPGAYEIIRSQPWSPTVSNLIRTLHGNLRQSSLQLIRTAYQTINVSEMMALLDLTASQCQEGLLRYCSIYA
jgi:hypothetical protein